MIAGPLEQAALLLLPWSAEGGQPAGQDPQEIEGRWRRAILDPEGKGVLGFACRRPGAAPGWLHWLTRSVLEVRETEDASLLLTIQCPWLLARTWDVYDAEDNRVGTLSGNSILDRFGRTWAVVDTLPGGDYRFLMPEGTELGSLTHLAAGSRLTFAPVLGSDPFARMLLLAGSLALTNASR